jgi:hypothetical protein
VFVARLQLIGSWFAQVAAAVAEVNADRATLRKYWERTGCLLTADGTRDDRVHLHSGVELGVLPKVCSSSVVDVVVDAEDDPPDDENSAESGGIGLGGMREGKGEAKDAKDSGRGGGGGGGGGDSDEAKARMKREDIDNVRHDDDELDLANEDDPDEDLRPASLREALPLGWHVIDTPPAVFDKSLVGSLMALRWNVTGWGVAKIVRFYPRPKGSDGLNYEVKYLLGDEEIAHRLRALEYSSSDDASAGSWCLLRWLPAAAAPPASAPAVQ